MAKVYFDAPGSEFDGIVLKNAASDETLKSFITAAGVVAGSASGASGGLDQVGKKASVAGKAFDLVSTVTKPLTAGFTALTKGTIAIAGGMANYTKEQKKATGALQDLSNIIPGVLGDLGGALTNTAKLFEDNFYAFRKLSGNGITLGNRIVGLTNDFTTLGIDIDTLTTQLAANSEAIVRIGSGTRGVGLALDESKRFINEYGTDLQRFGYSFDEANEKFFSFLTLNSLALRNNASEMTTLSQRGAEYAKYLRQYSDLTGQQADQLEDQMKKQQLDAIFDNFINSINDPQERDRIRNAVAAAGGLMGDAGRELAMATAMNISPQTEASRNLAGVNLGFADQITNSLNMARTFNGSIGDFNKAVLTGYVNTNNANQGFLKDFNQTGFAISQQGGPLADTFMGIYRANQLLGKSQEDLQEVFRDGEKRVDNAAEGFIQLDDAMRLVRIGFSDFYAEVFDGEFQKGFAKFANDVKDYARSGKIAPNTADAAKAAEKGQVDYDQNAILDIAGAFMKNFSQMFQGQDMQVPKASSLLSTIETGEPSQRLTKFMTDIGKSVKEKNPDMKDDDVRRTVIEIMKKYFNDPNVHRMIFKQAEDVNKMISTDQITSLVTKQSFLDAIPNQFKEGTLGFGKLFQNFGGGQLATLHGEEAVIPKKSPLGGMLDMMQGDLGNLKQNMFTADGKMNVSGMMEAGQAMGAKYDAYAKENQGAIKEQGRGLVKSMTNLTDEDLDKMEQSSVKSNTTAKSSTSVNTMSSNKMDELIRINKQMLQELRSM